MRVRSFLSLLLMTAGVLAALPVAPAAAAPVKCAEGDPTPDDRVFPEPRDSNTFVRLTEFECAITLLDSQYPDLIEITTVGESEGGHPIYDILLTDETIAGDKPRLLVVNSIHGNEPGGREGAFRVIEDMVDPRFLAEEPWVQQVLDEYVIHFLFANPDGWVAGDLAAPPPSVTATRGNVNGFDLNRQFPVNGYIYYDNETYSQREAKDITDELFGPDDRGTWYLGTDNHGQGPDTYAAAGLQIVGQFDYQKSETLARFADDINAAMAEYDVLEDLETLRTETGLSVGPYEWGTLYDMLGYSASGSMIDFYNTESGIDGTGFATELTVGSEVNYVAWVPPLAQVWVDAIRAINYTMFKHAIDPKDFVFEVGGAAAYVFDPAVVTDSDENGPGFVAPDEYIPPAEQQSYRVTRMRFFEDLNREADRPLAKLRVADIIDGSAHLERYDSLVLANNAMPEGGDEAAYWAAIRAWIEAGGNLIVTDAAAPALAELGLLEPDAIAMHTAYVGSVEEFTDREHHLNANLRGLASQTFDTVPLGYAFGSEGDNAPNWTVDQAAWEAAGGYTAGLHNDDDLPLADGRTVYGELPLGEGRVRFLGAVLPDPTEEHYHPYGLQNYAVTYTGYTLLQNMLVWDNPGRVGGTTGGTTGTTGTGSATGTGTGSSGTTAHSTATGHVSPSPGVGDDGGETPSTGGGAALVGLGLLATWIVGRRRR